MVSSTSSTKGKGPTWRYNILPSLFSALFDIVTLIIWHCYHVMVLEQFDDCISCLKIKIFIKVFGSLQNILIYFYLFVENYGHLVLYRTRPHPQCHLVPILGLHVLLFLLKWLTNLPCWFALIHSNIIYWLLLFMPTNVPTQSNYDKCHLSIYF